MLLSMCLTPQVAMCPDAPYFIILLCLATILLCLAPENFTFNGLSLNHTRKNEVNIFNEPTPKATDRVDCILL